MTRRGGRLSERARDVDERSPTVAQPPLPDLEAMTQ
jgi:hypothetical protein